MPSRIAFVLILASWVAPAGAQNLVANPEFEMDIAGWSCEQAATIFTVEPDDRPEVECVWSTDDVDGLPNSGSGQVSLDGFSDTLIRAQIVQCVPVGSSRLYNVGGSLRTLASNGRAGQLDIRWYDDSTCQGAELGWDTVGVNLSSSFTLLEDRLVAPVGAASLKFTVISFALDGEEHTVQIDAAFVPEPTPSALLTAALLSIALIAGRGMGPGGGGRGPSAKVVSSAMTSSIARRVALRCPYGSRARAWGAIVEADRIQYDAARLETTRGLAIVPDSAHLPNKKEDAQL